jgi:hypothetical protein
VRHGAEMNWSENGYTKVPKYGFMEIIRKKRFNKVEEIGIALVSFQIHYCKTCLPATGLDSTSYNLPRSCGLY